VRWTPARGRRDGGDGGKSLLHLRNSRGQPTVAKQLLFYGCLLPGAHRFLRSSFYRSELVAEKLSGRYPKIICVLIDVQGVSLTKDIH
jgi:hypothetical protein